MIAFSSTYGSEYPFLYKSNVGSTLKPFIYCFLREKGITRSELFSSKNNSLGWPVKEVSSLDNHINIQDALLYSNNNAFLNASNKVNLNLVLLYLSSVLDKNIDQFYPSSILGATKDGLSLYDLAISYNNFFRRDTVTPFKIECLNILNKIFIYKTGINIKNAFIKTGTTNDNKERLAALNDGETTYILMRNENDIDDYTKEGNFINQIKNFWNSIVKPNQKPKNNDYKWT